MIKINGLEWEQLTEGLLIRKHNDPEGDSLTIATVAQITAADGSAELGFESITLWGSEIGLIRDYLNNDDLPDDTYRLSDLIVGPKLELYDDDHGNPGKRLFGPVSRREQEQIIAESEKLDRMYGDILPPPLGPSTYEEGE